jgi:aldehyde dehydrogenase (NAD+)
MNDDIASLVDRQRTFFRSGATRPLAFRRKQLENLRRAVQAEEGRIIEALQQDLGKGEFEAYTSEIAILYDELRFTRRHLRRWVKPRRVATPVVHAPATSRIIMKPLGVSAILAPWNYPFQLSFAPLISAIAAGDCCIVKPSEFAPATATVIAGIIGATFDPAYVACVTGDGAVAAALTSAAVDHIFFTGSTRVGRIVMKAAAERLIPVTLELGGKSPAVVTASAKVELAARRILWGKILNAAQTCIAPDYVAVHQSVADRLVVALRSEIDRFFPEGAENSSEYGRIVNDDHFRRLIAIMTRQSRKAPPVIGGGSDAASRFIAPTVYHPVDWSDPVMEDELFGPILPILVWNDLELLIEEIGRRPNPLAGYVFTEDREEKRLFTEGVQFGGAALNDTVVHLVNPRLPFGGSGPSGLGSYHGYAGFRAFSHEASVMDRATWFDLPLRYPPYGNALAIVRRILHP